jgi:fumarate hydratase class II
METRREHDALGAVDVPRERLWGAQTERARHHFPFPERMPASVLSALVRIKRAAAHVHVHIRSLDAERARAIQHAADELLAGAWPDEFPLSVWQSGSGTQTHMNVNEVLANRASELLGGGRGEARVVHPNDHVNLGQSTNDVFPTAVHLAVVERTRHELLPAVDGLVGTLDDGARRWADLPKTGRTHLQDATPVTLGQEFSGWAAQVRGAREAVVEALTPLYRLALGGTAVGTGLGAPPAFAPRVIAELAAESGEPFVQAPNLFAALASADDLVRFHGALRGLAVAAMKVADDVRWMGSGPRCGLGELALPANEPGSSVMPGKVNPTQAEVVAMVCARVLGNDVAVGLGGLQGRFELNTARPLLALCVDESLGLLSVALRGFDVDCLRGLEPRRDRLAADLGRSLMLVTALRPHLGYDACARIALHAHANDLTLREAATSLGLVTVEHFDAWVRPERMVSNTDG